MHAPPATKLWCTIWLSPIKAYQRLESLRIPALQSHPAFLRTLVSIGSAEPCPPPVCHDSGPTAAAHLADTPFSACCPQILKLVPTAPSRMVTIVAGGIPYKLRDRDVQCAYLHGALQLAQRPAAAAVRDGILAAAVNHLLGLDVEVRWQEIVAAEAGTQCGAFPLNLPVCRAQATPMTGGCLYQVCMEA